MRAIAGIWPFGRGEIRAARDARILFLPQRPYLPIGKLRDVVSYPMPASGVADGTLREALEAVGLAQLAGRLDEAAHWALQLSPGEQQRIAFARALVQKPEWLFLDEATSAVDEATESRLYQLVRERLPETTVFSVGHRATLRPFHARRLMVQPTGNSAAAIVELPATGGVGSGHGAPCTTRARSTRPGHDRHRQTAGSCRRGPCAQPAHVTRSLESPLFERRTAKGSTTPAARRAPGAARPGSRVPFVNSPS